jgi:hypothetical protein
MNTQEMVPVAVEEKEVFYYNEDLQKEKLGYVVSREYEGEDAMRHFFLPKDAEKEYSMGTTTDRFQFIDHSQAIQPLVDKGFKIKQQKLMRGGMKLWALLTPQITTKTKDPITWDRDLWNFEGQDSITPAVAVTTSVSPGNGISYQFGWFRYICSNGLVDDILGMRKGRYSHVNWSLNNVVDFVEDHLSVDNAVNPTIGTKDGVVRVMRILENLRNEDNSQAIIPFPVRKTVKPILRIPNWYQELLVKQFEFFANNGPKEVTALDVLNMITSPINYYDQNEREQSARYYLQTNRLMEPLSQLIGFMSLISGEDSSNIIDGVIIDEDGKQVVKKQNTNTVIEPAVLPDPDSENFIDAIPML